MLVARFRLAAGTEVQGGYHHKEEGTVLILILKHRMRLEAFVEDELWSLITLKLCHFAIAHVASRRDSCMYTAKVRPPARLDPPPSLPLSPALPEEVSCDLRGFALQTRRGRGPSLNS